MATQEITQDRLAVLDLDVLDLPERLSAADTYEGALVLLRLGGRPIGQAVVPFRSWSHDRPVLDQLAEAADSAFWERWVEYRLRGEEPWVHPVGLDNVDVVVCTRDRPDDLRKCLTDLSNMPQDGQRVLVVDNASATGETREVVEAFPGVVYAREDRPGLDIARNTALRTTDREIVAFIDDDAAPDAQWLRKLCRNFDDPMIAAAGGLTMPMELATDAQVGFERLGGFGRGFKPVIYDEQNCFSFDAWCAGAGVNMAIRRSIIEAVGWFDEALDAGTRSLAGGDADYLRRILEAGYRVAYDPDALNWHRHRRTMAELKQQIYGYEVSAFAIISKVLFQERNPRALHAIGRWMRQRSGQWRELLGRGTRLPFSVTATQIRGALAGPGRYRQSLKALRNGH